MLPRLALDALEQQLLDLGHTRTSTQWSAQIYLLIGEQARP
jgi:hypothetical protein